MSDNTRDDMIRRFANTLPDQAPTSVRDVAASLSLNDIDEYVFWRACGKNRTQTMELTRLTQVQADTIERLEDIDDLIRAQKQKILDDPETALLNMMPQAIGVLRSKLQEGDVVAARETIRAASMIKKARDSEKEKDGNEVKDASKRAVSTVTGRQEIAAAAKQFRP